jgi:ATP-binding cassette subfamily G (WHITE) protein 2 (SNQ2)
VEIPWNLFGGTLFWASWYWMVKFPTDSKTAATVWGFYMLFQIYYQTFAAAIASMSPNPMIASILFSTFFSFVIVFCGVVQPPPQLPYFWRVWMFKLSPFTWLIEGMLGAVLDGRPVRCTPEEFNRINPPPGQTCASYLSNFVNTLDGPNLGTGYYQDGPDGSCEYCMYRVGNDYLTSITMNASHRYRDFGIICAYIAFNIMLCFTLFYFFRIFKLSNLTKSDRKSSKMVAAVASQADAGAEKTESAINSTSAAAKGPGYEGTAEPLPAANLFGGGEGGYQGTGTKA